MRFLGISQDAFFPQLFRDMAECLRTVRPKNVAVSCSLVHELKHFFNTLRWRRCSGKDILLSEWQEAVLSGLTVKCDQESATVCYGVVVSRCSLHRCFLRIELECSIRKANCLAVLELCKC
jgi:hypothetical protein